MTNLKTLQFLATPEHRCSYIKGRLARTLFVDPAETIDQHAYSLLSEMGFRRSGNHIYRPHCKGCNACVSVRIPVADFEFTRRFRRIINKNKGISYTFEKPSNSDELYDLYNRYICHRHSDGDMFPPSRDQFESFLVSSSQSTYFMTFKKDARVVGVAVVDMIEGALAAVYTFYDPDYEKYSLGTYAILKQVEWAQQQGRSYLYLGYWVKECQKMRYKINFRPLQMLVGGRWLQLN